jgi:hypothetical protein
MDFHDTFASAHSAPQTAPSIKTMILAGALVLYALGFIALFPVAQATVAKSAADGNDPALVGLVGP